MAPQFVIGTEAHNNKFSDSMKPASLLDLASVDGKRVTTGFFAWM